MGEVEEQVRSLDGAEQAVVSAIYQRARGLLPDLTEGTSYGMPALRYRGRPLIAVAVRKGGLSVYPFSGSVVATVQDGLDGFEGSKGGIRFTAERPLPETVVDRLVAGRRAEIDQALDG